jgi:hypothetical protein
MASEYVRILDTRTLAANDAMPEKEALDLGAYRVLVVQIRVMKAGTGGAVKLQSSLTNEVGSFVDIPTLTWNVNAASNTVTASGEYGRYVRWAADGAVAGGPVVLIDVLAKE